MPEPATQPRDPITHWLVPVEYRADPSLALIETGNTATSAGTLIRTHPLRYDAEAKPRRGSPQSPPR